MTFDLAPLVLSLKLAFVTTLVLFVAGVPLAWWLSNTKSWLRLPVQVLVTMPLVLPPTVLGFYLLLGMSPSSIVGAFFLKYLNVRLVFSFAGLVIGSVIFSLPFMVNSILAGFEALPSSLSEASRVLGKTEFKTLSKRILCRHIKSIISLKLDNKVAQDLKK